VKSKSLYRKNEGLISVIVPVYKVEKYLCKCIDSIINQTYENLEIILVDDGSPDDCPRICDEYAKKDKRIKVIHKENGGVSSARNRGIEVATGDYIAFVDSDDWIESDMYECLYNKMVSEKAECAKGLYCINDDREKQEKFFQYIYTDEEIKDKFLYDLMFAPCIIDSKAQKNDVLLVCYLIKKDIIKNNNIYFKTNMKTAEDYIFLIEVLLKAKKLVVVDKILYHYRIRDDSTMSTYKTNFLEDMYVSIDFREAIYTDDKYKEILIQQKKADFISAIVNCCLDNRKWRYRYINIKEIRKSMKENGLLKGKIQLRDKRKVIFYLLTRLNMINLILLIGYINFSVKRRSINGKNKCNSANI